MARSPSYRVAVMGAGAWGTAFTTVLAGAGSQPTLWARRPEVAQAINRTGHNPDYLSDIELPADLRAESDAAAALHGAEAVVLAVPSQLLGGCLAQWRIPDDAKVLSLAKGIEVDSGLRMSQVIERAGIDASRIGVLSGPNLAREVAEGQPSASVIAATSRETGLLLQQMCHAPAFRAYTNSDVIGSEIGGTAKNVIALAVGVAVGIGVGHNTQASMITRGLAEISRLGEAMGADPHTFAGLAGLGDLVATCSSPLSRNRTFGEHLGRGRTVEEATALSRGVTEGAKSCYSLQSLARAHGVDVPIVDGVVAMVSGSATPIEIARSLMNRSAKPERT